MLVTPGAATLGEGQVLLKPAGQALGITAGGQGCQLLVLELHSCADASAALKPPRGPGGSVQGRLLATAGPRWPVQYSVLDGACPPLSRHCDSSAGRAGGLRSSRAARPAAACSSTLPPVCTVRPSASAATIHARRPRVNPPSPSLSSGQPGSERAPWEELQPPGVAEEPGPPAPRRPHAATLTRPAWRHGC
jgi:hypothetical protein